jgi:hypothetical protein
MDPLGILLSVDAVPVEGGKGGAHIPEAAFDHGVDE